MEWEKSSLLGTLKESGSSSILVRNVGIQGTVGIKEAIASSLAIATARNEVVNWEESCNRSRK